MNVRWTASLVGFGLLAFGRLDLATAAPKMGTSTAPAIPCQADYMARLKTLSARKMDKLLPDIPFEAWLGKAIGPHGKIQWNVVACDENEVPPPDAAPRAPVQCPPRPEDHGPIKPPREGDGDGDDEGDGIDDPNSPFSVCVQVQAQLAPHGVAVAKIDSGWSDGMFRETPLLQSLEVAGLGPTDSVLFTDISKIAERVSAARLVDVALSRVPETPLDEAGMIRTVKELRLRRLGPTLPDSSVGAWIAALAGKAVNPKWSVAGCGNHEKPADLSGTRDEWALVKAEINEPAVLSGISIRVGTCRRGLFGNPVLADAWIISRHFGITTPTLQTFPAKLAEGRR